MGPDSRFLGVVKADAYGHGAIEAARTLEELGAEYLAISNIDEARELRRIRRRGLRVLRSRRTGLRLGRSGIRGGIRGGLIGLGGGLPAGNDQKIRTIMLYKGVGKSWKVH